MQAHFLLFLRSLSPRDREIIWVLRTGAIPTLGLHCLKSASPFFGHSHSLDIPILCNQTEDFNSNPTPH